MPCPKGGGASRPARGRDAPAPTSLDEMKIRLFFVRMYIQRTLSPTLREALAAFPAVLLTGPRQSGKTTFLRREYGDR